MELKKVKTLCIQIQFIHTNTISTELNLEYFIQKQILIIAFMTKIHLEYQKSDKLFTIW